MEVDRELWETMMKDMIRPLPMMVVTADLRHLREQCAGGDSMPSVRALAKRWGVSRSTAHRIITGAA